MTKLPHISSIKVRGWFLKHSFYPYRLRQQKLISYFALLKIEEAGGAKSEEDRREKK